MNRVSRHSARSPRAAGRRTALLAAAMLAITAGLLQVGCGSDDSSGGGGTDTAASGPEAEVVASAKAVVDAGVKGLVASKDPTNLIALSVFMLMVGLVLVQLQILHVNPLLGMLGFHFYQVELKNSDTALVITRSRDLPPDAGQGQQLAPGLWLLI